jgi:hypothetical protein
VIVATVESSPHIELDLPDGCYVYQVTAVSSTGVESGLSELSEPVKVPVIVEVDDRGPTSVAAELADAAPTAVLAAGDVVKIAFSEKMRPPAPGDSITLRNAAGRSGTVVHGANARFSLNTGPESLGGSAHAPGLVLTIEILSSLAEPTAPGEPLQLPANFVARSGVTDPSGNGWDIAASEDQEI